MWQRDGCHDLLEQQFARLFTLMLCIICALRWYVMANTCQRLLLILCPATDVAYVLTWSPAGPSSFHHWIKPDTWMSHWQTTCEWQSVTRSVFYSVFAFMSWQAMSTHLSWLARAQCCRVTELKLHLGNKLLTIKWASSEHQVSIKLYLNLPGK